MLSRTVITMALIALAGASPLPLNINLGAYSPALVVGDGAMSFEEANAVTNLVNSLQGAAVAGAAAAANANGAAATPAAGATTPTTTPTAAAGTENAAKGSTILSEQASLPPVGMGKQAIGPRDVPETPEVEVPEEEAEAEEEGEPTITKRQSGFDRALTFAEAALTKGPKVQLGTGKEGSGVGILVDNNQAAAARAGTGKA